MSTSLSDEEKTLIINQTLYFFAGALASVFLSIYLFKLGGFPAVTLFYLLNYLLLVIVYVASGFLLKKTSSKFLICAALILYSLFWAMLFLVKQKAIEYLVPLGIWSGIAHGLFWSGLNLTQYIVSHQSRRDKYFGWLWSWSHAARGVAPVLGGIIIAFFYAISVDGYSIVFLSVLLINVVNVFFALRLPVHRGVMFSPKHFLTHKRSRAWKLVLAQQFILGLWDVSVSNLFGVILFLIFANELTVGTTNAILNVIAAAGAALTPVILRRAPRSPIAAGIASGIGLILFAQLQNITGLVILALMTLFAFQIVAVPLSSAILTAIDHNPDSWQHKYHMLIERDAALGTARSISFILLWLAFLRFPKETVAPVWLSVIAVFPMVLGILIVPKKT